MTAPVIPPGALDGLTVDQLDVVIAHHHADLTFRSPVAQLRTWQAIDEMLDRRNELRRTG